MTKKKRIAINEASGFVPGLNAVLSGAAIAAHGLDWELVGIRDGFDGLLYPERYDDGGLVAITPRLVDTIDPAGQDILGQAPRVDPFHVRQVDEDNMVQEVDLSDHLLERFKAEGIDALISVAGGRGPTILYKLHRKGLDAVCIPRSVENDVAATDVSFGFNSALSFTIEMLDRARQAAQSARMIGVVEVLGSRAGWLALQSGIAVGADAVLIPEIPYRVDHLVASLKEKITTDRPYGLVVVASGAKCVDTSQDEEKPSTYRASLSPLTTGDTSEHVIQYSGGAANFVATELQRHLATETRSVVLGDWSRCGSPSAVDRQLALVYGVGAIKALEEGKNNHMVVFRPPDIEFVDLVESINSVRTIPSQRAILRIARSLGICLGGEPQ